MTRVVRLHIGAPKTGTTYVQSRLALNVAELARHGVRYPHRLVGDPAAFHFRAALDVLGEDWGVSPGRARGSWAALVRQVRRHDGTTLVGHETLAPAPAVTVDRVMADLRGCEVHVVYSARDLGRQLPAAWQESVKQGRTWGFRRFLDAVEGGDAWFARAFDLPRVLETWGRDLPADRIHVVTVPRRNTGDRDLLWRRFCTAFAIDPAWAPDDSSLLNPSMGAAETQLVRVLNRRMGRRVRSRAEYDELVLRVLARERLSARPAARVRLPPERLDWAEARATEWGTWLAASGVDVIGDPVELLPHRPTRERVWRDPDHVSSRQLLDAALDALEAMTREAAGRPEPFVRRARRSLAKAPDAAS